MCHDPIGLHGFSALHISSQAYRICAECNRQLRHELFCNGEKPGAGIREGFRQKSRSFTSEPTAFGVIESFDFFSSGVNGDIPVKPSIAGLSLDREQG